jgi:DNA-binding NarL/FixJ family response regulator
MLSIAIVEDNIYALQALKEKLLVYSDIVLKHEAFNGEEIISRLSRDTEVDLVLMDIDMPEMDGITATGIIKDRFPHIKVVIVTIYDNDESIFNAINAGADSYILKETKAEKIYETIIDTLNGGAVMSPSIAVKALQALKRSTQLQPVQADKNPELSVREIEVLECLSAGLSNKRIADKLFISTFTVKRHIENIYRKLQAKNRVELVTKGKRSGLI